MKPDGFSHYHIKTVLSKNTPQVVFLSVTSFHTRRSDQTLSICSTPWWGNVLQYQSQASASADKSVKRGGATDPNNLARRSRRFQTAEKSAHFSPNRASAPPAYYRFVTRAEPPPGKGGRRGGEDCCRKQGSRNDTTSAAWNLSGKIQLESGRRERGDSNFFGSSQCSTRSRPDFLSICEETVRQIKQAVMKTSSMFCMFFFFFFGFQTFLTPECFLIKWHKKWD